MADVVGKGIFEVGFDPQQVEQAGREQLLPSAQRLAKDLASTFVAIKLIDIGKSGLDELENAQRVTAQTAVQLRAAGDSAGVTAAQIDELGQSMEQLAGFDDEAARSAANVLLRFQAFQGIDQLKRVEGDAADLAVTMGTDLPAAAELLGRALQSPENSARILKPAIGALTTAQKDAITAFTQAGDSADAQAVILDAVEGKVQGAAEAYGKTLPGQIDRATQSWKDAKAELVGGFAPAIELGANLTTSFAHAVQSLPGPLQQTIGGLVLIGGTAAALVSPVSSLVNIYTQLGQRSRETALATKALAEAEAVEGEASAASTATKGGLVSLLGKAGIAGAALIAAGAIYEFADSFNHAADSQEKLDAVTKQSTADANKYLDSLRALNDVGIGGARLDFGKDLAKIAAEGPAGIGVLESYRQHLADTRQSTSDVDKAINEYKSSQGQLNTNVAAGNAILDNTAPSASAAGAAILELSTHEQVAAQSAKDLAAAQQQANQDRATRLSSVTGLFSANQALTSAQQQLTQAERGQADAARGVEDAHRRVGDAERSRTDAVERLTAAEEALQKAQQPADDETLGKAQLDLADAHLRVGDAQSAVTAAEREAAKERKDGQHTAADVADADRKILEAKDSLQRAIYAEHDADVALQDVQAKGTDQDQAVIDAKKGVEDATRQVDDATRGVSDALRGVQDAQQRVIDSRAGVEGAYLGIATASAGVKDAQDKLYTGTSNATTALGDQVAAFDAIREKLDPSSPLRKNIDEYIGDLGVLRDIFTLDSSVPTEDILGRHVSAGQPSTRASGGWTAPNSTFRGGEQGFEIGIIPRDGLYQAPPQGIQVLSHPASEDFLSGASSQRGGIQVAPGAIVVHNPAPEPASDSVRRELAILSDKLALRG